MSEHACHVSWERSGSAFVDGRYSRRHEWHFDGGVSVPASASPDVVPLPLSCAEAVDPEEAFVAALSSCHMLWFLSLAARDGWTVDAYSDHALGRLEGGDGEPQHMAEVTLRPLVLFAGEAPDPSTLSDLHRRAHELCFIARSVRSRVRVDPRPVPAPASPAPLAPSPSD